MKKNKNIAIIPARSGSKGLKDKNIKLLNSKPLLAYTIEAALKSKCFDVVMVSTDSNEYANIAKKYGANVPFLRSSEVSNDKASSWSVVKEVLVKYKDLGNEFDNFMLLQPTSPFRNETDIENAFYLLNEKKAKSIVSVCEADNVPNNMYNLKDDMYLSEFLNKKNNSVRRQDQDKYYVFNGAIYLANVDYFMKNDDIYSKGCYAYIMPKKRSIDIDDEFDFKIAEAIMNTMDPKHRKNFGF